MVQFKLKNFIIFLSIPLLSSTQTTDVLTTIQSNPQLAMFTFSTNLTVNLPIIEETILGKGVNYTIFAPSDQAFVKVGILGSDVLGNIIKYHIIPIQAKSTDFIGTQYEQTLIDSPELVKLAGKAKQKLIISKEQDSFTIGNGIDTGKVFTPDIVASNGIIHIVDTSK